MSEQEYPFFNRTDLVARAKAHRAAYQAAAPFPSFVFDSFLPESFATRLEAEFPPPDFPGFQQPDNAFQKGKLGRIADSHLEGLAFSLRFILNEFNSLAFIDFLEELTGISGLIPDTHFQTGGPHQTLKNGKLNIHADFSHNRRLGLERRVNVIYYLNGNWKEEYGGDLEFWDSKMKNRVQKISPVRNRCVVFNTGATSFHGHPEPLNTPEGVTRKSLAFAYYTSGTSVHPKMHSSVWRKRPGTQEPRGEGNRVHEPLGAKTKRRFLRNASPTARAKLSYTQHENFKERAPHVSRLLKNDLISVVDVGCRGGMTPELEPIQNFIHWVGIDAGKDSFDDEKRFHPKKERFLHACLGKSEESRTLYITRSPFRSSLLRPIEAVWDRYGLKDGAQIIQKETVQTQTLPKLLTRNKIHSLDYLKVDTQGTELDILKASEDLLEKEVLMVETEWTFVSAYEGQPEFGQLDAFLKSKGFFPVHLSRQFHSFRSEKEIYSRGALLYGDALYLRSTEACANLSTQKLLKYFVLLCNYGYFEFARLLQQEYFQTLAPFFPLLEPISKTPAKNSDTFFRKVFLHLLEYVFSRLVALRQWNRIAWDSDRSY